MSAVIADTDKTGEAYRNAIRAERAADIRSFLASVRPLKGCCFCSDDAFHAGRGAIEQIALALEDENRPMPTAAECLNVLEFLASIQPISKKGCYGCTGDEKQAGLNLILHAVHDAIRAQMEVSHG